MVSDRPTIAFFILSSWLLLAIPCWSDPRPNEESISSQPGTPIEVQPIPPATVIGDRPPGKWSHLIVKSISRVRDGDLKQIPKKDLRMATKFNTGLLAHVQKDSSGPFRLNRVGVGCLVRINGRDVVIDSETHGELGAELSFIESVVLRTFKRHQAKVVLVGSLPQLGIINAPVTVRRNGTNQRMIIRYALLVNGTTGELDSFAWLVDPTGDAQSVQDLEIQCLPPNCVDNCDLYVDASEYRFGKIPSDVAYAAMAIPRGKRALTPPEEIRRLLARATFSQKEVQNVERYFRSIVTKHTATPMLPSAK